jgi:Pyridoxamine 5'-phosphate oxidase
MSDLDAGWAQFARAQPSMAEAGRTVLLRGGEAPGVLATVRGGASPRIHPANVGIVGDGLYIFLLDSAKRRDLTEDGRYAFHGFQDPNAPTEFSVRGRARRVEPGERWDQVAAGWAFSVDESYWLFELRIESAILGERAADEWPPRYTRWSASG